MWKMAGSGDLYRGTMEERNINRNFYLSLTRMKFLQRSLNSKNFVEVEGFIHNFIHKVICIEERWRRVI